MTQTIKSLSPSVPTNQPKIKVDDFFYSSEPIINILGSPTSSENIDRNETIEDKFEVVKK
jgi:hypothetical protein